MVEETGALGGFCGWGNSLRGIMTRLLAVGSKFGKRTPNNQCGWFGTGGDLVCDVVSIDVENDEALAALGTCVDENIELAVEKIETLLEHFKDTPNHGEYASLVDLSVVIGKKTYVEEVVEGNHHRLHANGFNYVTKIWSRINIRMQFSV